VSINLNEPLKVSSSTEANKLVFVIQHAWPGQVW
jgi:hypothetical protein